MARCAGRTGPADAGKLNPVAMVGVAQLVEPWIVIPVVVGSSPIVHPIQHEKKRPETCRFFRFYRLGILGVHDCSTGSSYPEDSARLA